MSAAPSLNGSGLKDLGFLGLGSETAQYEYQGVDHFLAVLDHENDLFATDRTGEKSQYFVFYNLSEQQFNQDFNISTSDTALTYESYLPSLQLLLVKMSEYEPHSVAVRLFEKLLLFQLGTMGRADRGIIPIGTAHFQAPETDRKKRADNAYRPERLPPNRKSLWPTVVVEVGFTEPIQKLKSDAIWWLKSSAGHVKNVITVSINKTYREIAIEKWENVNMTPDVIYRNFLSQEAGLQKIRISNPLPLKINRIQRSFSSVTIEPRS